MGHALRKPDPYKPISGNPTSPTGGSSSSSKSKSKKKLPTRPPPTSTMACSGVDEPDFIPDHNLREESEESGILESLSNERARDILRITWSDDFGSLFDLGTDIYSEIFRLDPGVKKLFKALDGYDLEKDPNALKQCAAFNKQALRFIQTVSMTVKNSSHLKSIDTYLRDIGRRHVQYKERGFAVEHWNVFETAITNVMKARAIGNTQLDETDRNILAESYKQLSRHMIASMTAGFRDGERQLQNS